MEGWVDLGSLIVAQPGIEPTTAWSQVRPSQICPNNSIKFWFCFYFIHLFGDANFRLNFAVGVGGTLKMQDKKMQDWNLEDNFAGLENAGLENAGVEKKSYMKYKW